MPHSRFSCFITLASDTEPNSGNIESDWRISDRFSKPVSVTIGFFTYFGVLAAFVLLAFLTGKGMGNAPVEFLLLLALLFPLGLGLLVKGVVRLLLCIISYAGFILFFGGISPSAHMEQIWSPLCRVHLLILLTLAGCKDSGFRGPE